MVPPPRAVFRREWRTAVTFLLASPAGLEAVAVRARRGANPRPALQWRTPHPLFVVCVPGDRRTYHDRTSATWGVIRPQSWQNPLVVELSLHHVCLLVEAIHQQI